MRLRFIKMNPSGNTTLFLLDPIEKKDYPQLVQELTTKNGLGVEQVAIIFPEETPPRMEMLGGEFCANASRSFAAWLAMREESSLLCGKLKQESHQIIQVSGVQHPLEVTLTPGTEEGCCMAKIEMPLPKMIKHGENLQFGPYTIVEFQGITHLILWERTPDIHFLSEAEHFLQEQYFPIDSIGLMFYNKQQQQLTPLVMVQNPYSCVWESSCGSGSSAVAVGLADLSSAQLLTIDLRQPGGVVTVTVKKNDRQITDIFLDGKIQMLAAGFFYFSPGLENAYDCAKFLPRL